VVRPALRLAGITETFDDMTKAAIPALWGRLVPRLPLPGQTGGRTFGVCRGLPGGGGMRYTAAVALAPDAPAPDGVEIIDIAERPYLVFRQVFHGGPLHPQMQKAVREIWGERVAKSGLTLARAPDLEVYPEDFQPDVAGASVEWWVPVEA
jgi:predicted transcriptional regulator YdeE